MYRSSRTALTFMAMASTMPAVITVSNAGEGSNNYSGLAQREMVRRQSDVAEGDRLLGEGRAAYAKGDYQQAMDKYKQALNKVPEAPMFEDRRASITGHLSDASVALAMQYRKVGKYPEARTVIEEVIKKDPENAGAKREMGYMDDPIRTNPALTFEHTQSIDKVRRSLYTAEGFYNLGKYDEAKREYEKVMRLDPYNSAARRGMEQLSQHKSDYYRAAYDQTRAELLTQVDAAWESSVPAEGATLPTITGPIADNHGGVAYISEKLRRILIPRIDFADTTVEEAIDFLRLRAAELDTLELDPAKKGVNFVVRRPRATGVAPAAEAGADAAAPGAEALPTAAIDVGALRVKELRIRNVPLAVALKYICEQTKLRYKVDDFAVTLVPQTETGEDIFTRSFTVPPDFATSLDAGGEGGSGAEKDPFAAADKKGGAAKQLSARKPILELLKASGIVFAEGASATLSSNGVLLVTNTPSELDKVEQLVQTYGNKQPKQVKITTKFVEITQSNSDELSFDWIVSPFGLGSGGSLFGTGGTTGNGTPRTAADFINPVNYTMIPGIPATAGQPVSNTPTAGLRSGDSAIAGNSINALLNNPQRSQQKSAVAPGILGLTGLFNDSQVQMIMRGLAQKKGTDLMTAPSVTAKSGQKATIEIIREFIYPTEYEPPQIPQTMGQNQGGGTTVISGGGGGGSFPVTPATPTAFETRNTGVTLEIEPTIGENDYVIDLRFVPEIVEFEGFINYGSPIQTTSTDMLGNPVTNVLTENRIEMPVFATRRVNTQLTIYDGYTVAVGGLMREDVQKVEDRVPILGDIPIIGRLFQSTAENRIKSNLIVFVSAQIIDATGRPLRGVDAGATPSAPTGAPEAGGTGVLPALDLPPP